ncbi:MAG: cytochrome c biogenesis protein ResB [Bacteroidota bacterium]
MSDNIAKRRMWEFPWSFRESFVVVFFLLIIGIFLEFFIPLKNMLLSEYPANIIIIGVYFTSLILTYLFAKNQIIDWLASVPAAVASISFYTLLVLLMGFIPQTKTSGFLSDIGFNHMQTSRAFIILSIFLLTVLGYTILKRISGKISIKNLAFFLNHFGLFIILIAGSLGSGDMVKVQLLVNKNDENNLAIKDKQSYQLPFTVELINFSIEEYSPELIFYSKKTGFPVIEKGDYPIDIRKGNKGTFACFSYEIIDYQPNSVYSDRSYKSSDQFGSTHAAYVKISGVQISTEGWISCRNYMFPEKHLEINDDYVLVMISPKPKKYSSLVNVYDKETKLSEVLIEVNKPCKFKGWTIYQYGFDNEMGRWSQKSVFEVIRDPWLPVVYVGIFMMLLGSIYLLWTGRILKTKA